ncbi:MAG: nucleoside phosphorylase [Deltaproteobacteria bacterium]|nr:nucleoside phosphorylase [Deltaproteobacteria bacterium]
MVDKLRSPLLDHDPGDPPVFLPGNLLEAARRRKRLPRITAPAGCLLDFDGELADHLLATGRAAVEPAWPCFHTRLLRWKAGGAECGVIGGTVGAPFAVLVAEELFALGCDALVSISSAGLIAPGLSPPFFLLIEKALRDEGTSHHYFPAGRFSVASPSLIAVVARRMAEAGIPVQRGTSWTTDAPFRETGSLIAARRDEGVVSVEMEAAALIALGAALGKPVVCLAHVTNAMATRGEDFEKGGDAGLEESLTVCALALSAALEHAEDISNGKGGRKGK